MTGTATKPKAKRTPEEVVRALLDKTVERGCTAGEEAAAVAKAEELIAKHGLDRSRFTFPPERKPGKKGRTIQRLCEELLVRDPALSYDEVLASVRAEFPGCKTSIKCLRFYVSRMRGRGIAVPARPRPPRAKAA